MRKLVFYHAEWCGPCRYAKKTVADPLKKSFPDMVELIDVQKDPVAAQKAGVTKLPAYQLIEDRRVDRLLVGGVDVGELRQWLEDK